MRIYSGHVDARVEGMRAGDALGVLRKDIMAVLRPFLDAGEYRDPRLFGSVAKGSDTAASDIDILLSKGPAYSGSSAKSLYIALINAVDFPIDIAVEELLPPYIDISCARPLQES